MLSNEVLDPAQKIKKYDRLRNWVAIGQSVLILGLLLSLLFMSFALKSIQYGQTQASCRARKFARFNADLTRTLLAAPNSTERDAQGAIALEDAEAYLQAAAHCVDTKELSK